MSVSCAQTTCDPTSRRVACVSVPQCSHTATRSLIVARHRVDLQTSRVGLQRHDRLVAGKAPRLDLHVLELAAVRQHDLRIRERHHVFRDEGRWRAGRHAAVESCCSGTGRRSPTFSGSRTASPLAGRAVPLLRSAVPLPRKTGRPRPDEPRRARACRGSRLLRTVSSHPLSVGTLTKSLARPGRSVRRSRRRHAVVDRTPTS